MADRPNTTEEWRDIPGYEGRFQASSLGRVRSLPRTIIRHSMGRRQGVGLAGKVLKPSVCNGYWRISIEGGRDYVHRLVCLAFHGPAPDGHEVAHGDGDRLNSKPENLRWATRLENIKDKVDHGTQPCGEQMGPNVRLTDDRVREIRKSSLSNLALAEMYGVNPSTVSVARRGKTWAHVEG